MNYLKITKEQAYYLGIVMWGFLYLFPEIDYKWKLPKRLYSIIKQLYYWCPCCAVFNLQDGTRDCPGCPLENNCIDGRGYYKRWSETTNIKVRKQYAKIILDKIILKGWE